MATAWETDLGISQGRVQPANTVAPEGDHVYALGDDRAAREVRLEADDYAELRQDVDLAGVNVLRVRATLRAPADVPAGHTWAALLMVDGTEYTRRTLRAGRARDLELVLNAAPLAGTHTVGFRLVLEEV